MTKFASFFFTHFASLPHFASYCTHFAFIVHIREPTYSCNSMNLSEFTGTVSREEVFKWPRSQADFFGLTTKLVCNHGHGM